MEKKIWFMKIWIGFQGHQQGSCWKDSNFSLSLFNYTVSKCFIMFHFLYEFPTEPPVYVWSQWIPVSSDTFPSLSDNPWMTRHVRDVCGHLGSTAHNPTKSIWDFELFTQFSPKNIIFPRVFNLHSPSRTQIQRFWLIFCELKLFFCAE